VRLTLPARAALRHALAWVESKRGWIEAQLAALPATTAIRAGAIVPFEGRDLILVHAPDRGRNVVVEGDRLLIGGPEAHLASRLLRWLRAEALAKLDHETRVFAVRAGVAIGRVGIGDPRSRWGSCTSTGDIRYSWRLILAPTEVCTATVAHEVAHRLHMHHGPAFHRAVAELLGHEPKSERAWLRAHGAKLHAIGR
ncbi:M48 family metallopeptidase, partial [Sphingomonas bacterium]|uniref:M48 family metallopeptidase n=1 Tax=Sphingomonas bacterium TaxID=1895847 RepID=UPI0015766BE8